MRCDPKPIESPDGCFWTQCSRCNLTVRACHGDGTAVWKKLPDCGELAKDKKPFGDPSLADRIGRYSMAVARWIAAGRPVREWAEVERIFDEVCRPCGTFDPKRGSCQGCGCKINRSGRALMNKIRMGSEFCPQGRW